MMWSVNRILTVGFDAVFGLMASWPALVSLLLLAGVTGVLALLAFRYTSNQDAIGRVRDQIKANLLAVKLFKDDVGVMFRAQGRLFLGALRLLYYSLPPFVVMLAPMVLLLCQMGLRYEKTPLSRGAQTLLAADVAIPPAQARADIRLECPPGIGVDGGPVFVPLTPGGGESPTATRIFWRIRVGEPGTATLTLHCGSETVAKEIVIQAAGARTLPRVSPVRPGAGLWDQVLYPAERPGGRDSAIQAITVDLPARSTLICGFDVHWLATYFVASMVLALVFKPVFKVRL